MIKLAAPHAVTVKHERGVVILMIDATTTLHIDPHTATGIGKSLVRHAAEAHKERKMFNKYIGLKGHN